MMLDVLVTGANGFVGSGLHGAFRNESLTTLGLCRRHDETALAQGLTITDYSPHSIRDILEKHAPRAVVHAVGSASVQDSLADPYADFQSSVVPLHNVLEGIRLWGGLPTLVFLSSAAVYGNPERLPVPEDAPTAPMSPYGAHKLLCEELLKRHHELYGLPVIVARAFSLFGTRQKRLLIWELYRQIRTAGRIRLRGTGREQRDYLDIDTFAGLLRELLHRSASGFTVLNVASGVSHSVLDVIDMFASITGMNLPVETAESTRKGDPPAWRADVSRLENILARPVKFDFRRSLARCVASWDKASGVRA